MILSWFIERGKEITLFLVVMFIFGIANAWERLHFNFFSREAEATIRAIEESFEPRRRGPPLQIWMAYYDFIDYEGKVIASESKLYDEELYEVGDKVTVIYLDREFNNCRVKAEFEKKGGLFLFFWLPLILLVAWSSYFIFTLFQKPLSYQERKRQWNK